MNKIAYYLGLIFLFLGLSKGISQSSSIYISNNQVFANYFADGPLSLVLIDSFSKGVIVKTYYHRYMLIYGFKEPKSLQAEISKEFFNQNRDNIGLSLYRVLENGQKENSVPAPPGCLYLNNSSFGTWSNDDSGQEKWTFHDAYSDFPNKLRWGSFRPSRSFFKKMKSYQDIGKAFYGINREFGIDGDITKQAFPEYFKKDPPLLGQIRNFLYTYFRGKF